MSDSADIETQWYWDRRTSSALYPRRTSDGTVEFVTVWHAEEAADALDSGALVPLEDATLDRSDPTFDLLDSFRFPDHVEGDGTLDGEGD